MEKPENIIETRKYTEPNNFEHEREAILFFSYLEAQDYIDYLESELKKLRVTDVSVSVCDCDMHDNYMCHLGECPACGLNA